MPVRWARISTCMQITEALNLQNFKGIKRDMSIRLV